MWCRSVENACLAFLLAPTSHFLLSQIAGFLFFDSRRKLVFRFEEEGVTQKAMVFIRMNISRRGYFLTRLHKNYIYLLLPYGEFFLWLTLIIFWRIPFFFQHKSLICYLLLKPASRWNKILCWIVRRLW